MLHASLVRGRFCSFEGAQWESSYGLEFISNKNPISFERIKI